MVNTPPTTGNAQLDRFLRSVADDLRTLAKPREGWRLSDFSADVSEVISDRRDLIDIVRAWGRIEDLEDSLADELKKHLDLYDSSLSLNEDLGGLAGTFADIQLWWNENPALYLEDRDKISNALSKAEAALSTSQAATSTATSAESKAGNAISRVTALEAMSGLSPESPIDGQTANLIEQEDTLTRQAVSGAITDQTRVDIDPPITGISLGMSTTATDNTMPLRALLAKSATDGRPATLSQGVYPIRVPTNKVLLPAGAHWSMVAEPGAILKNADQVVTENWHTPLVVESTTGDVERVDIQGLGIDANLRGQDGPPTPYGWEHAASMRIHGKLGARFRYVNLRDLHFRDPIADCVYSSSYYIDKLLIQGMYVRDRTATRSDIQLSGLPRVTQISDFMGYKIETEPVPVPDDVVHDFLIQISNSHVEDMLDLMFLTDDRSGRLRLQIDNITAGNAIFSGVRGVVANSNIHFRGSGSALRRINYATGLNFHNCDIYIHSDINGHVEPLTVYNDGETDVSFRNCRFHLVPHPDYVGTTFTGDAVKTNPSTSGDNDHVFFDTCWWDGRFESPLRVDRTNRVDVIDCDMPGTHAITWVSTDSELNISGGDYSRSDKFLWLAVGSSNWGLLKLGRIYTDWSKSLCSISGESSLHNLKIRSDRLIYVTAPPAGVGLLGDRARLDNPVAGEPYEWVCTRSGSAGATWAVTQTLPSP